jgi:hypothetical protein
MDQDLTPPEPEELSADAIQQAVDNNALLLRRQALNPAQSEYKKNATTGLIEAVEYSRQLEDHIPARILYKRWQHELIDPYGKIMALSVGKLPDYIPIDGLEIPLKASKNIVAWLDRQYTTVAKGYSPLSEQLVAVMSEEDAPKMIRVKNAILGKEKEEAFVVTVGVRLIAQIPADEKARHLPNRPVQLTLAAQAKLRRYAGGVSTLLAQENISYHWTQHP